MSTGRQDSGPGIYSNKGCKMGSILGAILAFVIVFGILVFVHEFGHFFMAKLVGIKVEVFSFGYGKRLIGFKKGDTDYRISLVPMGGYVRFPGEESLDEEKKIVPGDFRAAKRWQRFLVILMGPIMNILLAVVLVAFFNMKGASVPEYQKETPVIGWIEQDSPAEHANLQIGDEILSINNKKTKTWNDVSIAVGTKPEKKITIEVNREGEVIDVELLTESRTKYETGYAGFFGKILTQVKMVTPGLPADKAGMLPGDVILAINSKPVYFFQFLEVIQKNPGNELDFLIERNGETLICKVTPRHKGDIGEVGIAQIPKSSIKKYAFFPAFIQSVKDNTKLAFLVVDILKDLVIGEVSTRQIAGPIEIANLSYVFLRMGFMALAGWIALISLQLGIINLVPIPVLDGGLIFVLILEGIFRRDFNAKLKRVIMQIGFAIFIFLIVFVILNDVVRRLPNGWQSLVPF